MIAIDKDVGRTIAICVMSGIFPGAIAFFSLPPFEFVLRNITYLSLLGTGCALVFMIAAWYFESLKVGELQQKIDNLEKEIKNNKGEINGTNVQTKTMYLSSINEQIDKDKGSINNAPAKHI